MANVEIDQYTAKMLTEIWDAINRTPVDIEDCFDAPEKRWKKFYKFMDRIEEIANGKNI